MELLRMMINDQKMIDIMYMFVQFGNTQMHRLHRVDQLKSIK
jgi:hypothetical protein